MVTQTVNKPVGLEISPHFYVALYMAVHEGHSSVELLSGNSSIDAGFLMQLFTFDSQIGSNDKVAIKVVGPDEVQVLQSIVNLYEQLEAQNGNWQSAK